MKLTGTEAFMIYWKLFYNFLLIGCLSFGGGYGMISLVRETVLENGWLTETEFINFIAVSESTPGPLAVNMATFIGSSQGGIPGAILATLGVVLPSFLIILLIASVLTNLMKYKGVNAFLSGVRPCVVTMILATGITMALSSLFSYTGTGTTPSPDIRAILVFALLLLISLTPMTSGIKLESHRELMFQEVHTEWTNVLILQMK